MFPKQGFRTRDSGTALLTHLHARVDAHPLGGGWREAGDAVGSRDGIRWPLCLQRSVCQGWSTSLDLPVVSPSHPDRTSRNASKAHVEFSLLLTSHSHLGITHPITCLFKGFCPWLATFLQVVPRGQMAMSGDTSGCHNQEEGCYWLVSTG